MGWSGPVTHRQHVMVSTWLAEEWNKPGRLEHYLMLINTSVNRVLSKHPSSIRMEHSRLEFKFEGSVKLSKEERDLRIRASQAAWRSAAGGLSRMTILDRDGNVIRKPTSPIKSVRFFGRRHPSRVSGTSRQPSVPLPGLQHRRITPSFPQRQVRNGDAD